MAPSGYSRSVVTLSTALPLLALTMRTHTATYTNSMLTFIQTKLAMVRGYLAPV